LSFPTRRSCRRPPAARFAALRASGCPVTASAAKAASATSRAATGYADHASKGHDGARIWVGWAILAYILGTLAIRAA